MVLVTVGKGDSGVSGSSGGGGSRPGAAALSSGVARSSGMDKAWGVTVAPPPQQHKRTDPLLWHKNELTDKERAKQLRKLI